LCRLRLHLHSLMQIQEIWHYPQSVIFSATFSSAQYGQSCYLRIIWRELCPLWSRDIPQINIHRSRK
jgi:hypothetical protein